MMSKIFLIFIMATAFVVLIFGGMSLLNLNLASLYGVLTATVTINPLYIEVTVPSEVEIDKVFQVEARIINKGGEKIENGKAEIFLPPELILLKKDLIQEIGIIPGKKEKKVRWSVKGTEVGSYIISVKASGELGGREVSKESSAMVKIKEKFIPGKGGSANLFQTFFSLFRGWFDTD